MIHKQVGQLLRCNEIAAKTEATAGRERRGRRGLALAGLEARIRLADNIDPSFAANDLAVRVTIFKRFDGGYNFHSGKFKELSKKGLGHCTVNTKPNLF